MDGDAAIRLRQGKRFRAVKSPEAGKTGFQAKAIQDALAAFDFQPPVEDP